MFVARQRPLLVLEDRLLALRLSLNTPLLATAEIASSPARAAIFAWAEGPARRFAVVVRALGAAEPVVYELQAEVPDDADGWSVALDAALSFGESMGFLFDDEIVVERSGNTLRQATTMLRELLAPGELEDAAGAAEAIGSSDDLAEILLEDELDALASEAAPPAAGATGPVFAPGVALSRFRAAPAPPAAVQETVAPAPAPRVAVVEAAPSAPVATRGTAKLGRVRPVRVRADGDATPKPDPLMRLLADF